MTMTKAVVAIEIGVGLTFGAAAQLGKHLGEKVDLKSLPASVQQTINQEAAGGRKGVWGEQFGVCKAKEGLRGVWGCLGLKSLGGLGVKRQEVESLQGKLARATRERSSASVRNSSESVV
jgi:hypothetical protein